MNNSVFGKTMENIRIRVDIRLITNEDQARKLISKPNYQHRTIFCENLTAIHMKKTKFFSTNQFIWECVFSIYQKL